MVDYSLLTMLEKSLEEILQREDPTDGNLVPFCTIARGVLEVSSVKVQFIDDVNMQYPLRILPNMDTLDKYHGLFIRRIKNEDKETLIEETSNIRYSGSFTIEINLPLLHKCRFNATELCGLLLNAVLYTFYSDKVFDLFYKSYYELYLDLPPSNKDVYNLVPAVNKLVRFPILEYFEVPVYNSPNSPHVTEMDKVVFESPFNNGYVSALEKMISRSSNFYVDMPYGEIVERGKNISKWVFTNTEFLKYRKSKLRDYLRAMISDTTSKVLATIVNDIYYSFFKSDLDEMSSLIESTKYMDTFKRRVIETTGFEPVYRHADKVVKEGLFNRYKAAEKFDMSKIDILQVEIDRIESYDDKIFVINLIHEYLDVFYPLLSLDDKEFSKRVKIPRHRVEGIIKQLEDYLTAAKNAKVYERRYGVFVKYPVGYDG